MEEKIEVKVAVEIEEEKGVMAESVDAADLKSVDCINREGSSPSIPTF